MVSSVLEFLPGQTQRTPLQLKVFRVCLAILGFMIISAHMYFLRNSLGWILNCNWSFDFFDQDICRAVLMNTSSWAFITGAARTSSFFLVLDT